MDGNEEARVVYIINDFAAESVCATWCLVLLCCCVVWLERKAPEVQCFGFPTVPAIGRLDNHGVLVTITVTRETAMACSSEKRSLEKSSC